MYFACTELRTSAIRSLSQYTVWTLIFVVLDICGWLKIRENCEDLVLQKSRSLRYT